MTTLANTVVGFNNLVTEIQNEFVSEYPWQDKQTSSLNTFLVDVMAGLYSNAQTGIDVAQLEAFLTTARRDTSIFACTRMLGVKLNRRTSAKATFNLTNNSAQKVSIAPYAQINVSGRSFYSPVAIILEVRETKQFVLYEGTVRRQEFDLALYNLVMPEFKLNEPGFVVATHDLLVYTQNKDTGEYTLWQEHDESLTDLTSTDAKYFETTTGDGRASLLFGDGTFGRQLTSRERLIVQYVVTQGENGNTGTTGTRATVVSEPLVTGTSIESITGGTYPKSASYYKKYVPHIYQSKNTWVRPSSWKANIMAYPGVADCEIQSQRDVAPNDPSWRNVVRVCVLPSNSATWGGDNPNPRSANWNDFVAYAQERIGNHITIQTYNPRKILIDLVVEVSVESWVNLQEMKATLRQAIIDLFKRKPGMLGKRFSKSDVVDVCKFIQDQDSRREGVDYVEVISPKNDLEPESKLDYVTLNSLNIVLKYTEREGR